MDLSPFVPRLVADWVTETPEARHRAIPGTMVFTDLSGFTAMSEKLATLGKLGAEELTEHLDTTFSELLDVAGDYGGSLLKFGGDALLLFFWGDDHALRGARACVEMQARLRQVGLIRTSAGQVRLRMSVGAHTGDFDFFLVGETHRELFLCGPAATTTVEMEADADATEVLLSPALAAELAACDPRLLGEPKGGGVLLRRGPPAATVGPGEVRWPPGVNAEAFVPRMLREELASGIVLPEHRQLVMAFIHLANVDRVLAVEGPHEAATRLDRFVAEVQAILDRHGVAWNATDIYDDGPKILATAGAPRAWEDDDERMLRAMREIVEAAPGAGIDVRIGVNRGHGYAGQIGPPYRRNYVTMGDVTNTAARVMSKAQPGQLLTTAAALERSAAVFDTTELPPFAAKGKKAPLVAFAVGPLADDRQRSTRRRAALVGRQRELAWLEARLEAARQRQGALVGVVGDAGLGKSRILDELAERASAAGIDVVTVQCSRYSQTTPYLPLRLMLPPIVGGDAEALERTVRGHAPQLLPWLPLLAVPLGIEVAPTPEVERLDERFVRRRLHRAVAELLESTLERPAVWVVDDAQWLDEASSELLTHLSSRLSRLPLLVIAAQRPHPDAPLADRVTDELALEPIDERAAAALVRAVADRPLLPQEIAELTSRAAGNPLFLEELTATVAAGGDHDLASLPDTVEGLVAARIDSLSPPDRLAVRQLSVLGMATETDTARAIVEQLPPPSDRRWQALDQFVERRGDLLAFRHALTRDVAYEGLTYRQRRHLHLAAGRYLEATNPDDEQPVDLLALHFSEGGDHPQAWRYASRAGRLAWGAYAFPTAATQFERAVAAARAGRVAEPGEVGEVLNLYGRAMVWNGRLDEASVAFSRALRFAGSDAVTRAQLSLRQGLVRERKGRYDLARRWYRRGLRELGGCDDVAARPVRVRLQTAIGFLRYRSGDPAAAVPTLEEAVATAADPAAVADPEVRKHLTSALAQALSALHMCGMALGHPARHEHAARAVALLEEAGDRLELANVLNNIAMDAHLGERWPEATERYRQALANQEQVGAVSEAAVTSSNLAEILSDQGHWEEAEEMFRSALDTLEAAGSWMAALARSNLGRVLARQGHGDEGRALLESAHAQLSAVGAADFAVDAAQFLAEAAVLAGDPARALAVIDEHLADPDAAHRSAVSRLRGLALLQQGGDGVAQLRAALEHARAAGSAYQEALALHALAEAAPSTEDRERHEADLVPLLERLGITRLR